MEMEGNIEFFQVNSFCLSNENYFPEISNNYSYVNITTRNKFNSLSFTI